MSESGAAAAAISFLPAPSSQGSPPPADAPSPAAGSPGPSSAAPSSRPQQPWHAGGWISTTDYCNGGPVFLTPQGSTDLAAMGGVRILAWFTALPALPAQPLAAGSPAAAPAAQPDAPAAPPATAPALQDAQAVQQAGSQGGAAGGAAVAAPAAVCCSVGRGRAVLCGTHPELHPSWLDACGRSEYALSAADVEAAAAVAAAEAGLSAGGGTSAAAEQVAGGGPVGGQPACALHASASAADRAAAARLEQHTAELRQRLLQQQPQRDLFLASLLVAALG